MKRWFKGLGVAVLVVLALAPMWGKAVADQASSYGVLDAACSSPGFYFTSDTDTGLIRNTVTNFFGVGICAAGQLSAVFGGATAGDRYTIIYGRQRFALRPGTALPTLTSGWGTGATIRGSDSAFEVTIGTADDQLPVMVATFANAWEAAPGCTASDNTGTANEEVTKIGATTTAVTLTATNALAEGTKVNVRCSGLQ